MRVIFAVAAAAAAGSAFASVADQPLLLTPLLKAGKDVRAASQVGPLPGINFTSYSGFFTVNETANANSFFWYVPALNGNKSAPVVMWMQGGPGSSSLFAFFVESGPVTLDAGLNPHANPYTWAAEYDYVVLDNPRQTGYSFSNPDALCTDWNCYGRDIAEFVRQFVAAYSLEGRPFYIAGESYGGHYVPAGAYYVMAGNDAGLSPQVNLSGIMVGNGFSAPYEMTQGYPDALLNFGLVSDVEYAQAQQYVKNITAFLDVDDYVNAYLTWDAFLNGDSTPGGSWFYNTTGITNYFNTANGPLGPEYGYYASYVTSPAVRAALHVGASQPYNDGNLAVELALKGDVMYSQKQRIEALLSAQIPVLIYNGALDLICGAPLTERYVPTLAWPGATAFNAAPKVKWHDASAAALPGTIAGFARSALNLVQVQILGAGHLAPADQPFRARDMIDRFIAGRAFD